MLDGQLRMHLGVVFRTLAEHKESRIEEWQVMRDAIGPGVLGENKGNFAGQSFWARVYFAYTVGRDAQMVRNYIWPQQEEDD